MQENNFGDTFDLLTDEDPNLPSQEKNRQESLFDEIEEEAYDDLFEQTKKAKMIQRGGDIRTQEKRPFSKKLTDAF